MQHHDLDQQAAENLMRYLADQAAAAGVVPDDRTILVERCRDELGDWRICVLTPFGGRIHAPWAMAVVERVRAETGLDVETMWTDDGFVVRFPETDEPPDPMLMIPPSDEAEALVLRQLGGTAHVRGEVPRGGGTRAAAAQAPAGRAEPACGSSASAPRISWRLPRSSALSRCCSRRTASACAMCSTCRRSSTRCGGSNGARSSRSPSIRPSASPFASALLFGYVANYIYDGDAPLAERRAQALSIDQAQLRELLGEAELRELLDADALAEVERQLQQLGDTQRAKTVDGVHDLLLRLGDLTLDEIAARSLIDASEALAALVRGATRDPGQHRRERPRSSRSSMRAGIATRSACRCRPASPSRCSSRLPHAAQDLARRYARTHGPFTSLEFAARYALGRATAETLLQELASAGRLLEGEFRPGGAGREWCDPDVLQSIRRRSLAKLRQQVEPVDPPVLVRLLTSWQGVIRKRAGPRRAARCRSRTFKARRWPPRSSRARSSRRASIDTTLPTWTR